MAARRSLGFTLIEIIIVMALLAILSTALWSNFISAINKGKDSRRKQDLRTIAEAFELYYNDYASYPSSPLDWGNPLVHPDNPGNLYLRKIPTDPLYPNRNYCYDDGGSGEFFVLYANLENQSDPDKMETTEYCSADSTDYNYVVKSSNYN